MDLTEGKRHRVVIVGGGFGGLYAARALKAAPVQVTVVDRRNYHLFQPLLYQVATALLNPSDIASPIRKILRSQKNAQSLLAEVTGIDAARKVILTDGELPYEFLILAPGSTHSYFGNDDWELAAPSLKTVEDALEIRRRILTAYELAEKEADEAVRRQLLTFVIVGAGPTGVELAGALADVATAVAGDFRNLHAGSVRIVLVEAGPRILPAFPENLASWTGQELSSRNVEIVTGRMVTEVDEQGVSLGKERIQAANVLWAAGVSASPLGKSLGAEVDKAGRVIVEPDLSVPGHPEIFVIGDLAAARSNGKPVPGVATAAIQQGRAAAENIMRKLAGAPGRPFVYRDKGVLATVGRGSAVASFPRFNLTGFPAKLIWLVVHIYFLIGFRNRLLVVLQWAWAAMTRQRGARLITESGRPPHKQPAETSRGAGAA